MRHSGLQREVLQLYKSMLLVAKQKDSFQGTNSMVSLVRHQFRQEASAVDRKNFLLIEHLVRKGQKQLKQMQQDNVRIAHRIQLPKT